LLLQASALMTLCLLGYNIWLSIKHHKNPSKASLKKVFLYPLFAYIPIATGRILFGEVYDGPFCGPIGSLFCGDIVYLNYLFFLLMPFLAILFVGPIIFIVGWIIYKLCNILLIPINSIKKSYDSLPDDTVSEASAIKKAKYEELTISLKELEPEITIDEYGEYQVEGRVLPFKSLNDARAALKRIKDED
jgi:hypothetical protein